MDFSVASLTQGRRRGVVKAQRGHPKACSRVIRFAPAFVCLLLQLLLLLLAAAPCLFEDLAAVVSGFSQPR